MISFACESGSMANVSNCQYIFCIRLKMEWRLFGVSTAALMQGRREVRRCIEYVTHNPATKRGSAFIRRSAVSK